MLSTVNCGAAVLAEESGSRTHQGRLTPLNGFEVRALHRAAFLFRDESHHYTGVTEWRKLLTRDESPGARLLRAA
jgi:hypothetical protein